MKARILFVHNSPMSFVAIDLALLRERYEVTELFLPGWRLSPARVAKGVLQHDLVFGWFASRHSVLPVLLARLLGKPSLLVVGGYDVASLPEIGYGHQRGGPARWVSRLAIHSATHLLTNAEFSRREAVRNTGVDYKKITVIHHGLDMTLYPAPEPGTKEPMVITVANVNTSNLTRKGLKPFVEAAKFLPEMPFVLIGRFEDGAADYLKDIASPNVTLTGFLDDAKLREYLCRARVYVQASQHEGFGLALAEAMLSGCVPVATRVGALPEVVGGAGIYLPDATPTAIADGVRQALALGNDAWRSARERITREFPLERRRRGIFREIDRLLTKSPQFAEREARDAG
jgi:glycosyltransferase involved in cell wall biosynthesis